MELDLQLRHVQLRGTCTGGGETTRGVFFLDRISAEKLKIDFSFFCGGCTLVALFSRHFFEFQCAFRLLIPPDPTWTFVPDCHDLDNGVYCLP